MHSLPDEPVQLFDLGALGQELASQPVPAVGRTTRVLFKSQDLTLVSVFLPAGSEWKEHKAPGPATAQVVRGKIRFVWEHGEAMPGNSQVVLFAAGLPHSVVALEDTLLLVTIGYKPGGPEAAVTPVLPA